MHGDLRDAIKSDGFATVPGVLSRDEIHRLIDEVSAAAPRRSRAGIRHALSLKAVAELAQQPKVIGLARAVLGASAFPYRATLFDKIP